MAILRPLLTRGGGSHLSVLTADPAAGAELTHTVPAGKYWRLISCRYTLTTNAVAGTRASQLVIADDAGNTLIQLPSAGTQPISVTYGYNWAAVGWAVGQQANQMLMGIPDLVLAPGYVIKTVTASKDAGDDYSAARLLVVEYGWQPL